MLWELGGIRSIGPQARAAVEASTELRFSTVSFAEIGVKAAVGKLTIPSDLGGHVIASGLKILGLTPEHGLGVADLPMLHRDPFDRLLISQARLEGLALVTADRRFENYDVEVVAADD